MDVMKWGDYNDSSSWEGDDNGQKTKSNVKDLENSNEVQIFIKLVMRVNEGVRGVVLGWKSRRWKDKRKHQVFGLP